MARFMSVSVELKVPAATFWGAIRRPELVPQLMPQYVSGCEYVEGHGDVGSIRFMTFGPAVAHFVTFAKERIEVVDDLAKKIVYSVIDGELLKQFNKYKVCLEIQGTNENECTVTWNLEYEPIDPDMPPPAISKEGAISTFKAFEAYLLGANVGNTK